MAERRSFAALLEGCPATLYGDRAGETAIADVAYDSRRVRPGEVFVAIPGYRHDGLDFVHDAVERGAVAVVAEAPPEAVDDLASEIAWARVGDARAALARIACNRFDHPSDELTVVGVTGTNGKTTTTCLLEAILRRGGPVGRWSTTAVRTPDGEDRAERTTPESVDLQRALRRMADGGCRAAVLEVSSHALALHRVDGTRFDVGVFTNLSPEHLDFHGDMDGYLEAKSLLFSSLPASALAVLNTGDPAAGRLAAVTDARLATFGWEDRRSAERASEPAPAVPGFAASHWRIHDYVCGPDGLELELRGPDRDVRLRSPLIGPANAENVAAAAVTALETGAAVDDVRGAVAGFGGVPGRFERVDDGQGPAVIVDYAHTPTALEAVLEAARSLVADDGRLVAVFGCGGDRDRGKRPRMGDVAARRADRVVLTNDNPRGEEPTAIVEEILAGFPDGWDDVDVVLDRREAIRDALHAACSGDCVVIAGKGHETEQTFADGAVPFDDRQVARACLREAGRREARA